MVENSLQISTGEGSLINGSPKSMYVFFLLKLCTNYFDVMRQSSSGDTDIESATAALVAFCPNRVERERIWKLYVETRDAQRNKINASIMAVGELVSYLSDSLEFEEESTGGLM